MVERVKAQTWGSRNINSLSGGMRQRVASFWHAWAKNAGVADDIQFYLVNECK
jgi:ABC-type proline/glycine betaine transport system ATPase subunit